MRLHLVVMGFDLTSKHRGRARWGLAITVALSLHGLLLAMLGLVKPSERLLLEPAPLLVTIEPWPEVFTTTPPRQASAPMADDPLKPAKVIRSDNTPVETRARPSETPPPSAPPPIEAPTAPTDPKGVVAMPDQKQVMGKLSARNAAVAAWIKHDICVKARAEGKEVAADCPLNATREVALPLKPPETRPRKLCIAKRQAEWQRYRDGKANYPGLREMFKGNSDCRKDWPD